MKSVVLLLCMVMSTSAFAHPTSDDDTSEGVHIDEDGVRIDVEGLDIDVSEDGIEMSAPGAELSVSEEGIHMQVDGQTINISDKGVFVDGEKVDNIHINSDRNSAVKGKGPVTDEARPLAPFTRVVLRGSINVTWEPGNRPQAVVTAQPNLIPHITTEVSGSTLIIRNDELLRTSQPISIALMSDSLRHIEQRGSGAFTAVELDERRLDVDLRGSGDIDLQGSATELVVSVRGSGDVAARGLEASIVDIEIRGSGDVETNASKSVDAEIRGSGDIDIYGDPKRVDEDVRGSGDISVH